MNLKCSDWPVSFEARPWRYLGLTLGSSWLLWVLAAALDTYISAGIVMALHYLGGLAPLAVALAFVYGRHGVDFRRDFWRRITGFRQIGWGWYLAILLYFPIKSLLPAFVDTLLGGWGIRGEAIAGLAEQPLLIVPTLIFWLVFGPIPEEPGWRGYALDGLQARYPALSASLLLGAIWAAWHLPLFLIQGTWQAEQVGLATDRFWLYMLTIPIEAVLYTCVYNNTGRSTLSAILFHFSGNAFGELYALSARTEIIGFVLSFVVVMGIVIAWGPQTLSGQPKLFSSRVCKPFSGEDQT